MRRVENKAEPGENKTNRFLQVPTGNFYKLAIFLLCVQRSYFPVAKFLGISLHNIFNFEKNFE